MDEPRNETPFRYGAAMANELELRWQGAWDAAGAYRTPNPGDAGFDGSRPKFYCLDMFPYPSGAGLHVGHPLGYIATDMVKSIRQDVLDKIVGTIPVKRLGTPEEIASICAWLSSDESGFSTGADFSLNGGLHMG